MHLIIKKPYLEKIKHFLQIVSKEFHGENILFKVTKNNIVLFLSSFNANSYIRLELFLNTFLDIKTPGETLINVKIFCDLLEKLDISKDLEIYHADKNYFQFFSGSYECDLVLLSNDNVKDQNISKEIESCKPVTIPYKVFKESYVRLKDFCKSFENSLIINPILTNIHFKKDKGSQIMEVWASDAYRAICGEFKLNENEDFEFQFNFHPSIIALLIGIYSKQTYLNLYLVESGEYLVFNSEGCTVKTKLDRSSYPSFTHWFNMPKTINFTISKKELLNVIDRNLLIPNKDSQVTLYKIEEDSLLMEHKNSARGKCREFLEIKGIKNQKLEFYLNNLLLKSLIKSIDSEEIVFKVCDALKPIVLLPNSKSNFKQFILPSRNV